MKFTDPEGLVIEKHQDTKLPDRMIVLLQILDPVWAVIAEDYALRRFDQLPGILVTDFSNS